MISSLWPLVFFTLILQMAVGAFVFSETIFFRYSRRFGVEDVRSYGLYTRIEIFFLSTLALVLSFFHLGNPLRAIHSLRNLGSSWLSREILFLLFFLVLVAGCFLSALGEKGASSRLRFPVMAAGIAGLLLVGSMSAVYMLPAVPPWSSFWTPLSFFSTSVLLGAQLTAAGINLFLETNRGAKREPIRSHWCRQTLLGLEKVSVPFAGLSLLSTLVFLLRFDSIRIESLLKTSPFFQEWLIFIARSLLSILGVIFFITGILQGRRFGEARQIRPFFVYAGFFALLLAEICGRYLFFAVYSRSGI